ncbi:TetR/AcrR family transcriptional regulator C-terminal domain-containing protein [Kitasatospora sp. NPDC048722]|uniref:TetR/AcrR family transcriptional regulator C-terminal domain-containing protein n=1 Tax=Kitasatospora sp. NPDC048722 TaxID=3155639 RepID=UPI0033D5D8AE
MTPQRTPGTPKLDRKLVADTALRLLDEVGLDGLTLRAIAAELGVKAPALYWHFKDKQALLDEMATEMMRRMSAGSAWPAGGDWRDAYRVTMRALRAELLRHRDGAKVYSGARFTDTSYAPGLDAALRLLVDAGFAPAAAARAWYTAYSYTIGYVVEEQAMGADPFAGGEAYDVDARAERLAGHPLAAEAGRVMFRDFDEGFELGLTAVLAGVEATLLT